MDIIVQQKSYNTTCFNIFARTSKVIDIDVLTIRRLVEKMFILKAIKSDLKGSYE